MLDCWEFEPEKRISFSLARQHLAAMLEEVTEDYSYLKLDQERDYYNVPCGDDREGAGLDETEEAIVAPLDRHPPIQEEEEDQVDTFTSSSLFFCEIFF